MEVYVYYLLANEPRMLFCVYTIPFELFFEGMGLNLDILPILDVPQNVEIHAFCRGDNPRLSNTFRISEDDYYTWYEALCYLAQQNNYGSMVLNLMAPILEEYSLDDENTFGKKMYFNLLKPKLSTQSYTVFEVTNEISTTSSGCCGTSCLLF